MGYLISGPEKREGFIWENIFAGHLALSEPLAGGLHLADAPTFSSSLYSTRRMGKPRTAQQPLETVKNQTNPPTQGSLHMCAHAQFSSVTQSCLTLCDPMNRSTPGLPVHHQLPEFIQTHVHRVRDAIPPSHPLLSPSPPAPNPSQHQSLFQ